MSQSEEVRMMAIEAGLIEDASNARHAFTVSRARAAWPAGTVSEQDIAASPELQASVIIAEVRAEMLAEQEAADAAPTYPYAGQAHAAILDAMDSQLSDEQWEEIEASASPVTAKPAPATPLGAYFPGWHGVTEMGW